MMKHEKNSITSSRFSRSKGLLLFVLANTVDIVVDERVRLKCRVPVCDSY